MKTLISIVSLQLFLVGCATVSVNSDFNSDADFSGLKTFQWLEVEHEPITDPVLSNTLTEEYVVDAVNAKLEDKRLALAAEGPVDFLVDYHIDVRRTEQVVRSGARDHDWPEGGGGITTIYESKESLFILDFLDPNTEKLIWRGWAKGVIEQNPNPHEIKRKFEKAVDKILKRYPPREALSKRNAESSKAISSNGGFIEK